MVAVVLTLLMLCPPAGLAGDAEYLVYVGTYTRTSSRGIYAWRLDSDAGTMVPLGLAAEAVNPSFLALHPNRRFLYTVCEMGGPAGGGSGAVSAFTVDSTTGKLTLLNKVSSRGDGPCFVSADRTGKNLLVANYSSGGIAVIPVNPDGSLSEASSFVQHRGASVNPRRQQGPHAHSILPSPDNRFVLAADLGLDQILVYRFDPDKGLLAANQPPFVKLNPGAGPRHFAFHPTGQFVYSINELQSTVTAFAYEAARGVLKELQTVSTLPEEFTGENSTAEVQVHPGGRFLYGSNRGHDSIAVFAVDGRTGALAPIQHVSTQGKTPRNFGIDPSGLFLIAANQASDKIVLFRIDPKTGRLQETGQSFEVGAPVCVKFLPVAGRGGLTAPSADGWASGPCRPQ